ncbi:hypothetical protein [Ekhidna sp.]|uniref:hypothetical protein n=1 Tax=Ekhidna sp. TaxID=2608089 RepID=UPI003CCC3E1A
MKKPKFNKLITLLLLLGTFAFFMEAEQRVSTLAQKELSRWASLLPVNQKQEVNSINPYKQNASLLQVFQADTTKQKVNSVNN